MENDGSQITSKKRKISHSEFVDSVSELIPKDSLIATGSSGLAIEFLYAKNKENQRIFLTSGLGSMGYGLSQAVGICFARAKSTVFAFESDGSLMLNIQELATVKSYQLPIKLFIMNNGGYASIRNTQTNYFSERFIGVDKNSGLFIPSFKDLSIAFGLEYYCINSIKDLTDAFTKDSTKKRPAIFDVFLEQTDILEPKSKAVIHDDGSITSMPLEDLSPLLDLDELKSLLESDISKASIEAREEMILICRSCKQNQEPNTLTIRDMPIAANSFREYEMKLLNIFQICRFLNVRNVGSTNHGQIIKDYKSVHRSSFFSTKTRDFRLKQMSAFTKI